GGTNDLLRLEEIGYLFARANSSGESYGQKAADVAITVLVNRICSDTRRYRTHSCEPNHGVAALEDINVMSLRADTRVLPPRDQGSDLDAISGDDGELRHICSP